MTSAWGKSWGNAWGNSWGTVAAELPPVTVLGSVQLAPFLIGKTKQKRATIAGYSTGGNYARATVAPRLILSGESEQQSIATAALAARISVNLFAQNNSSANAGAEAVTGYSHRQRITARNNLALTMAAHAYFLRKKQ